MGNKAFYNNKLLDTYLREISIYPILSSEEEIKLARLIKKGNRRARDTLIKSNLRFVVSVAKNYQNQGMLLPDLINAGNVGLIKAVDRYDEKKNFKFISYAVWWVRQSMLKSIANNSRIVRVPLEKIGTLCKTQKAISFLEQKFQRTPTISEIASEIGKPILTIKYLLNIGNKHISLNSPVSRNSALPCSLLDNIVDKNLEKAEERIVQMSEKKKLYKLLNLLNSREQIIISMTFGLGKHVAHTTKEIGCHLGISREYVRLIRLNTLQKLRRLLKQK